MALPQGIDFRATSTYVSDPANCTYSIATSVNYPTVTPQGNTVGWESISNALANRDRNSSVDARLAGVNTMSNANANTDTFRIDLPASGSISLNAAFGDVSFRQTGINVELFDNVTSLGKLVTNGDTTVNAGLFDATGVLRTSASDWVANNAALTQTFSSTILRLKFGGGSSGANCAVAHIYVASAGGTVINLAARSSLAARARAPLTGVAALKGHSVASLHGVAKASSSTSLKAHSSLAVEGKAAATYVAALHTHGVVSVHGSAKASGTTQLKARGSTALRSRTTLASGLILLASRTLLALRGKGRPSASAALKARSELGLQTKAKAAGTVSLKARTTTQVKARTPMLPAIFLKARGLVGLRGAAKASGTARLAAKTTVASQSRASLSSGVRLLAGRSLVALRALSALLLGKLDPTRRYTLLAPRWVYTVVHPHLSYVLLMPGNATMPALRDLPPIDATVQLQTIAVDFGQFLPAGVTLTGTPTVTISVHSGTDSNPSSRLSGSAQVGTVPSAQGGSGVANTAVLQQLQNLLGGVTYLIEVSCARTDGDVASGSTHVYGFQPT